MRFGKGTDKEIESIWIFGEILTGDLRIILAVACIETKKINEELPLNHWKHKGWCSSRTCPITSMIYCFLLYINDIADNTGSLSRLCSDDTNYIFTFFTEKK